MFNKFVALLQWIMFDIGIVVVVDDILKCKSSLYEFRFIQDNVWHRNAFEHDRKKKVNVV